MRKRRWSRARFALSKSQPRRRRYKFIHFSTPYFPVGRRRRFRVERRDRRVFRKSRVRGVFLAHLQPRTLTNVRKDIIATQRRYSGDFVAFTNIFNSMPILTPARSPIMLPLSSHSVNLRERFALTLARGVAQIIYR